MMRELSLHILDIIQNSLAAQASLVELTIREELKKDLFIIKISDNGLGMDEKERKLVTDPFRTSRKTREVGLGLPFLQAAAEICEGDLMIRSIPGEGTEVEAHFKYSHIDRAPLGDIVGTIVGLIAANPGIDFNYNHFVDEKKYTFKTSEIKDELGEVGINQIQVLNWIGDYLREGLKDLYGGDRS